MDEQMLLTQATVGYIASALIEFLKQQKWFVFANVDTARLNRAFSMFVAFLSALAIHATYDSEQGVLTITGLTLTGVVHAGWAWIQQFALQQAAYKGLVQKPQIVTVPTEMNSVRVDTVVVEQPKP